MVLYFFCCIGNAFAKDTDIFIVTENYKIEDLQNILDSFNDKNFNAYLKDVTRYDSTAYRIAICKLFKKYKESLSKLNECSHRYNILEKTYSKGWAKELIDKFGIQYISGHMDAIKNLILNMNIKNRSVYCVDVEKDGLYDEVQYIITVREYFNHFLNYYEALDKKQKNKLELRKKFADNVIKIMSVYPFQIMLYGSHLNAYIDVDYQILLRPEVVKFLINNSDLSKPFDPVVAFNDLSNVCGKNINH